jgi:uncharacterized metal-binding protein
VSIECATCSRYACRVGRLDAAPGSCPMRGPFPDFEELYADEPRRRLAYQAARVEAEGYGRWTRLREVSELARRMGYTRLGIAHCPDTRREGTLAASYFDSGGLQAVLPPSGERCDPVGQALLFDAERTELNVVAGMCVGHDALFVRHSAAPVTSLIVRDPRLRHNPIAALYTRNSYLKSALYQEHGHFAERPRRAPWSDARIDRLAGEVRAAGRKRADPPCRLEETMDFARRAGATHLGLIFCSGFREEARQLSGVLSTNGFRLSSVCCKSGSVPKERIGIRDGQKVRPGRPEMICNPLAQAELVEREGVDLVLLMGQCVGHDSATASHLRTPVVFVAAKDRVLAHNSAGALYALEDPATSFPDAREES